MTRAQRLALLGPETVAEIHTRVQQAPPLDDLEVIADLRRILTRPAKRRRSHPVSPQRAA